jgi:hypothetical protein
VNPEVTLLANQAFGYCLISIVSSKSVPDGERRYSGSTSYPMCNENQLVLIGPSGPGFSLMDHRKKRESDSSHRKGRMKITATKTDQGFPSSSTCASADFGNLGSSCYFGLAF